MEMQFKNEIKKLADIVVWADNWITELKDGLTEEEFEEDAEVKEFEAVKKVVLESIDRHTTYTNALNKDIADKAYKIDLLEKEIEGRKEGYVALKERMDTKYISIDEHNKIVDQFKKEISALKEEIKSMAKSRDIWFDTAGGHSNTIIEQSNTIKKLEEKVKHQKENLDGINKTLEIRNKEIDTLVKTLQTTRKEIEAHESENARLSEKIVELKKQVDYLKKELEECKEENSYLKKESKDKNDIIRKAYVRYVDEACKGREEIINECYEKLTKDDTGYTGFKQYTLRALEAQEGDEKKTKEFLCDSAEIIFYNKRAEEKRKEETKKELNEAFGIPCGEDAIE